MGTSTAPDSAGARKARGAFFTPPGLCDYIAEWAIRGPDDSVLEPSCGEAAFLLAAGERLRGLGVPRQPLRGMELHDQSARTAAAVLGGRGIDSVIETRDFLSCPPNAAFDAVIGNPPYVRYQEFSGVARAQARAAALRAGVRLTALASSWAAFVVHAALFLKPAGRLGLVLPAELLSVNYAAEVRGFLMRRFARVQLVLFTERIFPGVQEEVVLLLAEGQGPTDHCELRQVRDVQDLLESVRPVTSWRPTEPRAKWTEALLGPGARKTYGRLIGQEHFCELLAWGETSLGAVTGNNKFFALSPRDVLRLGIAPDEVLEISPPGSAHLRGLDLSAERWSDLGEGGALTLLFRPGQQLSDAARCYVDDGENRGVEAAYKCRVRDPWWQTPVLSSPALFVTCMNADTPRLVCNSAGVRHLNSVHGLYLRPEIAPLGAVLPIAALNSLTLLGAETVGRAYGGGLLKLEPREADLLPVPSPYLVESLAADLEGLRADVGELLATRRLIDAVALVDEVLLVEGLGTSRRDLAAIRNARSSLAERRQRRATAPRDRAR